MKVKGILLIMALLLYGVNAEAQFLKDLAKRAEEKIAREAENRAQRRVDKKIDEVFDKAENTIDGKNKKKEKENKEGKKTDTNEANEKKILDVSSNTNSDVALPDSYNFEWKYVLKMESEEMKKKAKGNDFKVTYYLSPNITTFASKFEMGTKNPSGMGDMLMVMDVDSGVNLMLMEMNGQKIIQKMPSFSGQDVNETIEEQSAKNYSIVKIDTKTILGYPCQGFKITSEDGIIISYVAKNAPVSFNQAFAGNSKFKPKGFKTEWMKEIGNGLMLEMQFTSSKKKKHNMKMTCVELKKEPFTINMNDYKPFGAAR